MFRNQCLQTTLENDVIAYGYVIFTLQCRGAMTRLVPKYLADGNFEVHFRLKQDHYDRMGLNSMQTSKSDVFRSRLCAKFGRIRHFWEGVGNL